MMDENKAFLVGLVAFVVIATTLSLLAFSLILSVIIGALAGLSIGIWAFKK